MFVNVREDLILFVESEQREPNELKPSTLLGWVIDEKGQTHPVTPVGGVITGSWAIYDMQTEMASGRTTCESIVRPDMVEAWVRANLMEPDETGEFLTRKETYQ